MPTIRATLAALSLSLLIPLTGCLGAMTQSNLQALVGTNVDTLVSKWGMPDEDKTILGKHVVVWKDEGPRACTRTAELDKDNRVVNISSRGNADQCEFLTR